MVIFVENAYPGEIVDVKVRKRKKSYAIGEVIKFKLKLRERKKPLCEYFKKCDGCNWMDYPYEKQLDAKKCILIEQFGKILKGNILVRDIEKSDLIFRYRNKIILKSFFENEMLYFGYVGKDGPIAVKDCKVAPKIFFEVKGEIENILNALDSDVFKKVIRNLAFRVDEDGDTVVIFVSREEKIPYEGKILSLILKKFKDLQIVLIHNPKSKSALSGKIRILHGDGYLIERIDWFEYMIPVESFFQINKNVLIKMLRKAVELLNPSKDDKLLDLFCGVGVFGVYLSPLVSKVVGVDSDKRAVKFARANASINKLKNCVFIRDDALNFLKKAIYKGERFDKIILDPPREGIKKKGMRMIINLKPESILYISCNPPTLVRDIEYVLSEGYKVVDIIPFDMFPHTYHIEVITLLEKKR